METKKILVVSSSGMPTPPADYGGLEWIAYLHTVELHRRGHEVTICISVDSDVDLYPEGITVIPTVFSAILNIPEKEAWDIIQKRVDFAEFDVVQDHSHLGYTKFAQREIENKNSPGPRFFWTLHDDFHGNRPPPVKSPGIITPSFALGMRVAEALAGHGVFPAVAWHGIPLEEYRLNKKHGERYMFLGRIQALKGVHLAVLLAHELDLELDVVGDDTHFGGRDPYSERIRNMCDGEQIIYHGKVTTRQKIRMLRKARALISPSTFHEPFGLMSIEAQAVGTPSIVSAMGGLPETVKNGITGRVCTTPGDMRDALAADGSFSPIACREWIEENFSVGKMVDRYEKIWSGGEF